MKIQKLKLINQFIDYLPASHYYYYYYHHHIIMIIIITITVTITTSQIVFSD